MRAAFALALAGCIGGSTGGAQPPPPATGLVLTLHFDHTNVESVALSGSTSASARRFGPYVVAASLLPRDSTVGFVFDPSDEGTAMVCGESRDLSGKMLQQGCDTFDIIGAQVTKGSLTLSDPYSPR